MKSLLTIFICFVALIGNASEFTINMENDTFNGTDSYYTHGTRFIYTLNDYDYIVGQNMYTPSDIRKDYVLTNDRPYAGWAYIGLATTLQTEEYIHNIECDIGIVGEHSYADEVQTWIHKSLNNATPKGWQYQVEERIAFQLRYKASKHLIVSEPAAILWFSDNTIGNIMDYTGLGFTFIAGHNIPAYLKTSILREDEKEDFYAYMFSEVMGKYVFYNYLLEGPTPYNLIDIEREPWVGEAKVGVGIGCKYFHFEFAACFVSNEFKTQEHTTVFNTITLTTKW